MVRLSVVRGSRRPTYALSSSALSAGTFREKRAAVYRLAAAIEEQCVRSDTWIVVPDLDNFAVYLELATNSIGESMQAMEFLRGVEERA